MAAGVLIVQEAGGVVTQTDGKPFTHSGFSALKIWPTASCIQPSTGGDS
jgi:fructose-1,6-bisphosphatase/inositol monophosphatase family enzyme